MNNTQKFKFHKDEIYPLDCIKVKRSFLTNKNNVSTFSHQQQQSQIISIINSSIISNRKASAKTVKSHF
jgi:hypothetical protein